MKEFPQAMWHDLFLQATPDVPLARREFTVVRRRGQLFLFLPKDRHAAVRALELYPAQTFKARLAKRLLTLALRLGRPELLGTEKYEHVFSAKDPFLKFLSQIVGFRDGELPQFAVLAGNPNAPGQRFVFLLFDATYNPVAVVKAGPHDEARIFIRHELNLLKTLPALAVGVPRLKGDFTSLRGAAFAVDFIPGESPSGPAYSELEKIFGSWLDESREVSLKESPAWQRLVGSLASGSLPESVRSLGEIRVHPTLMHGDFAPWNIKVADGRWTVLDWERGERVGVPGWDWLHFVVQPAVLVRRESTEQTLNELEQLFASVEFGRYAKRAGITGQEWPLAAAYVNYCLRVTQQTEGAPRLELLLPTLETRAAVTKP